MMHTQQTKLAQKYRGCSVVIVFCTSINCTWFWRVRLIEPCDKYKCVDSVRVTKTPFERNITLRNMENHVTM